jgi:AmmeMemoRadiSam system protein B
MHFSFRYTCLFIALALLFANRAEGQPFASMYSDPSIFVNAIEKERLSGPSTIETNGITVPHHLLAADLIARGFWITSSMKYDRILVLSPDHFRRSRRILATTTRSFDTVFGTIDTDVEGARTLLQSDLVEESDLFEHEHGVAALLPFIKHFFPKVPLIAVTLSTGSFESDWTAAAQVLLRIITRHTLIVQSTDFSHYLLPQVAAARDQETLNVIAQGNPSAISALHQSNNLDSKAAQFVQMTLQASFFGAYPTVIANRNQVEYAPSSVSTTSYIVEVYTSESTRSSFPNYDDQQVFYFGGDVFPGRWLSLPLARPEAASKMIEIIRHLTGGKAMIINLEGVLLDEVPPISKPDLHVIDSSIAAPILRGLNVVLAGVANNHSFDLGPNGLKETIFSLTKLGIRAGEHMRVVDLGSFRLVTINFVGAKTASGYPFAHKRDLQQLCKLSIAPPVVAFVHWGEEYSSEPTSSEIQTADALHDCGISLIIGAHSHTATSHPLSVNAGEFQVVFSLGNLLFDQRSSTTSGSVLELRIFKQKTMATRLYAVPNFFNIIDPPGSFAAQ